MSSTDPALSEINFNKNSIKVPLSRVIYCGIMVLLFKDMLIRQETTAGHCFIMNQIFAKVDHEKGKSKALVTITSIFFSREELANFRHLYTPL